MRNSRAGWATGETTESTNMLKITMASANPFGRDKTADNFAPNEQLVNEWFEFENICAFPVDVGSVVFSHLTWQGWEIAGEEGLGRFADGIVLQPGEALRLHSGFGFDSRVGDVLHIFRNAGNYVLNNMQGDRITLRDVNGNVIDSAYYEPYPPEGEILFRIAA